MRQYLVCYYVEQSDCSTDLEKIIEAENFEQALINFKNETLLYRKIMSISEIVSFEQFNTIIKDESK